MKVIVGLGKTGLACAEYFFRHGESYCVQDRLAEPVLLPALRMLDKDVIFGPIDAASLMTADEIILSPGVPLASPEIQAALTAGVTVTGDVAMFLAQVTCPVIAITGSNGKSTVTSITGALLEAAGFKTGVGGNIGTPCLELLKEEAEVYVLELSSYQLELVNEANCDVAVVLNLSPDHMDRYASPAHYYQTKSKVYRGARVALINRNCDYEFALDSATKVVTFGADVPTDDFAYGIREVDGELFLARGAENLLSAELLNIRGTHNYLNALVALAIAELMGATGPAVINALTTYRGLAHRCEWLGSLAGVEFINDSKATNPGATRAALQGFSGRGGIVLILGGDGKGADFSQLREVTEQEADTLLLFGRDANLIYEQLGLPTNASIMTTLEQVVDWLKQNVKQGSLVLLSPGCASLDQFRNFEHRGDEFKRLVTEAFQ